MKRSQRHVVVWTLLVAVVLSTTPRPALAAPGNDNVANATPIGVDVTISGSNVGATTEPNEQTNPTCDNQMPVLNGASVWYKVTLPTNTDFTMATIHDNTTFDTVIGFWADRTLTGSPSGPGDLNFRACNDDRGTRGQSVLNSGTSVAITSYWISVSGFRPSSPPDAQPYQGSFVLSISQRARSSTICANTGNYFSVMCREESFKTGLSAQWSSQALNISRAGGESNGWIEHAIWFNDRNSGHWLEFGDTAGTKDLYLHENLWQRWWFWVDGNTGYTLGGAYREYAIQEAPTDGVTRQWMIQWDPGVNSWGLDECETPGVPSSCTRKATVGWIAPASMSGQLLEVGMEVGGSVFNVNTNTPTFQASGVLMRNADQNWSAWPSDASSHPQVDNPCQPYSAPFCLNGSFATNPPPTFDNWLSNKP